MAWRACGRSDPSEIEEPWVEPNTCIRQMANRGDATNSKSGLFADAGGIGPSQAVIRNGFGRSVAASDEQKVQATASSAVRVLSSIS